MAQSNQWFEISAFFHPTTTANLGETYPYTWSHRWSQFEAVAVRTDEAFQQMKKSGVQQVESSFEQEPFFRTDALVLETEGSAEQMLNGIVGRLGSHLPSKSIVTTTTLPREPEVSILQAGQQSDFIDRSQIRNLLTQ